MKEVPGNGDGQTGAHDTLGAVDTSPATDWLQEIIDLTFNPSVLPERGKKAGRVVGLTVATIRGERTFYSPAWAPRGSQLALAHQSQQILMNREKVGEFVWSSDKDVVDVPIHSLHWPSTETIQVNDFCSQLRSATKSVIELIGQKENQAWGMFFVPQKTFFHDETSADEAKLLRNEQTLFLLLWEDWLC